MKNKIISLTLSIALLVTLFTFTATPATALQFDGFIYYEYSTYISISGYTGTDSILNIPSTISGKPVTKILSDVFKDNITITDVTIPNSVTFMGPSVFMGCKSLNSITLSTGITALTGYIFKGCSSLENIILPSNLTFIDSFVFESCTSLTSIDIPAKVTNIGQYVFFNCKALTAVNVNEANPIFTSIDGVLYNKAKTYLLKCPEQKTGTFIIPDIVEDINVSAFAYCDKLTNIVLPENVYSIGYDAFSYCTSLTSIDIPDKVTFINYNLFEGCTSLSSITIPKNITSIYKSAFKNCSSLTTVFIPTSVTAIGESAFENCTLLSAIILPPEVESIGINAFKSCPSLTMYGYPGSVAESYALSNQINFIAHYQFPPTGLVGVAPSLININNGKITGTTTDMEYKLSSDPTWTPVTGTEITDLAPGTYYVRYIEKPGYYASEPVIVVVENNPNYNNYEYSDDGTSVTIVWYQGDGGDVVVPSHINGMPVTVIEYDAFSYYSSITSVTLPDTIKEIQYSAFRNCENLESINIPDGVTTIDIFAFKDCTSLKNINIPGSVKIIGNYSFYACSALESVNLSDGIEIIDTSAFDGCTSLKSIEIPSSVKTIGNYSFYGCSALESVNFSNGIELLGDFAFKDCVSLTEITLPPSMTTIGKKAFSGCTSLSSITIPINVTSVMNDAFQECPITLKCYTDSYAHRYALQNYYRFYLFDALPAPAGLSGISPATDSETDGKITGTTTDMEYKLSSTEAYIPVTGTEITSLSTGTYIVRYKAKDGNKASLNAYVVVPLNTRQNQSPPTGLVGIAPTMVNLVNGKITGTTTDMEYKLSTDTVWTRATGNEITNLSSGDYYVRYFEKTDYYASEPVTVNLINLNDFNYSNDGISVTIENYQGYGGDVVVPSYINGLPVTVIKYNAFNGNDTITSVTLPDTIVSILDYAFSNCSTLTEINVSDNNLYYSDINGVLFDKEKTKIIQCPAGKTGTYTIPDSVTTIGFDAFWGCELITNIIIPDSVITIEEWAFEDCKTLTDINIPDSVTSIGYKAFYNCFSLTELVVPNSVTFIDVNVFVPNINIYCRSDSYAKQYAIDNSLNYYLINNISGYIEYTGVTVAIDTKTFATDSNGFFSFTNLRAGTYALTITRPGALRRTMPVTITDTDIELSTVADKITLISGDANWDDAINLSDLSLIKNHFNQVRTDTDFNTNYDITSDGSINISDLSEIKLNFGKTTNSY